ncbi:hypothetical protein B0H14DRAFT_360494 [Mycena olivaceomarginata]|nr:hypothetical protein B0H14DRAFT_360494 [Mycena olivaceomarginata]
MPILFRGQMYLPRSLWTLAVESTCRATSRFSRHIHPPCSMCALAVKSTRHVHSVLSRSDIPAAHMALLSGLTAFSDCTVLSRDFCPSSSQRCPSPMFLMSFGDSYAELANHLILRAKSSLELGRLLPYDGPLVRLVIQEQHELEKKIRALEDDGVTTATHAHWPTLLILVRVVHQNKRCLLAYHSQRLSAIRTAYWAAGGAAAHVIAQLRNDMSQDEIVYLHSYHESVVEYRQTLSPADVLDIAMGIEDPPRESPFITVEAVLPLGGPVHTESGLLDFRVGHRYVLQKRDMSISSYKGTCERSS